MNGTSGGFFYNDTPCNSNYSMTPAEPGVTGTELNFSAKRNSSLFGASETVQPKSMRSYFLIRYM